MTANAKNIFSPFLLNSNQGADINIMHCKKMLLSMPAVTVWHIPLERGKLTDYLHLWVMCTVLPETKTNARVCLGICCGRISFGRILSLLRGGGETAQRENRKSGSAQKHTERETSAHLNKNWYVTLRKDFRDDFWTGGPAWKQKAPCSLSFSLFLKCLDQCLRWEGWLFWPLGSRDVEGKGSSVLPTQAVSLQWQLLLLWMQLYH